MGVRRRARLLLAACGLAIGAAGAAAQTTLPGPAAFLPGPGRAPGWEPTGEIQRYEGDDLFVYIDGGAEIYREYGFRRVAARDYKNGAGRGVTLEIFEMEDPAAAFGVYSFKASGRGTAVAVGAGGDLEDYYLSFWKGSYQVTVTGFDDSPDCRTGVEAVAAAAASLLPGGGSPPGLFDRLPADAAASRHRKYLEGPIGLANVHAFFASDVLRFPAAAAAETGGDWAFLFRYASEAEAAARLADVRQALSTGTAYVRFAAAPDGTVTAADGRGRGVAWRLSGRDLLASLAAAGPDAAAARLAAFR